MLLNVIWHRLGSDSRSGFFDREKKKSTSLPLFLTIVVTLVNNKLEGLHAMHSSDKYEEQKMGIGKVLAEERAL